MKKIVLALAVAIVLPAAAHAADTAPVEKTCCCMEKAEAKACCDEHGATAGQDEHAAHGAGHR